MENTFKVNEIFWSIQGEGVKVGVPSIFLRISGCSIQCPYCDTSSSWHQGRFLPLAEILDQIQHLQQKYPRSQIVVTGGEPLENDLSLLVKVLKQNRFFVAIETCGHYYQELAIDWWSVSPKDRLHYRIHDNLKSRLNEVKLLVNDSLTTDVIKGIRAIREDFPIFLQPLHGDSDKYQKAVELFQHCQIQGIGDVRLGIQLHRLYSLS